MKVCPNCEHENPSSANHCMVCGTLLIDEEQLPEEVQLKKELGEAKKTIELLKNTLAVLQEKSENTANDLEVQQLKDQIESCNETIESLHGQIDAQKSEISNITNLLENEKKKKKGGKWGWLFVLLFFASAIVAYIVWDEKQTQDQNYTNQINSLSSELSSLRQENENGSVELNSLQAKYDALETKYDELKKQYPLIIDDIQIANTYYGGEIETDYGGSIYSSRTMYLRPKLSYKGYVDSPLTLKVKWIKPDGSLSTGSSSSPGFSQTAECSIYEGKQTLILSGWGGADMGHWGSGTYRIEIWHGNVMLKSKSFTVY